MLSIARVLIAIFGAVTLSYAAQADRAATPAVPEAAGEAIQEHIDEAEDVLDTLLDWRHVLTSTSREPRETTAPTAPMTTLISVPRADVERLSKLIGAAVALLPTPATAVASPRGDLRAHLEKAQEIARELMPKPAAQAVGTSGRADAIVIDRAALERLEVEIDAAERVAPRRLEGP